jgi:hypothetical protein
VESKQEGGKVFENEGLEKRRRIIVSDLTAGILATVLQSDKETSYHP